MVRFLFCSGNGLEKLKNKPSQEGPLLNIAVDGNDKRMPTVRGWSLQLATGEYCIRVHPKFSPARLINSRR